MLNSKSPVGTTDEKSTNVDAALGQAQLAQNHLLAAAFSAQTYAVSAHATTNHLYDNKPYSTHLKMVAEYALKYIHLLPNHLQLVALKSAWLHDTIEDCRLTYNDLKNEFSQEVADVVYNLTNEKGKTRKERANDKYYFFIKCCPVSNFVKICDRLANIKYSKTTNSKMFVVYKNECHVFNTKLYNASFAPMFDEMFEMFV